MDVFIDKKNNNPLSQWSTRCYRIRNCEFTQYKKGIDDFKQCTDELIKQRYNICDIEQILLNPKTPHILKVDLPSKYQENSVNLLLKFSDVNASIDNKKKVLKDVNHRLFIAIYRLFACSIKSETDCLERPLPSNICLALYYLLQRLYKHKATLSTQFIFQQSFSLKFVEKVYYDLIVNCKRFLSLDDSDLNNIHLLSITLLYTLQNMPTSLFCDSYCKELTDFVSQLNDTNDITHLKDNNRIQQIKTFLIQKYSAKKAQYRKKYHFHLFNRYGFMTILFILLHSICNKDTQMTAYDLSLIFGPCLQSKRYLYLCRTQDLNKNKKYHKKRRDKKYETEFNRMVQVLIYYADSIFPDLQRVKWKIQTLIHVQGQEKYMIKYYNDQFSLNTINGYYIAPILIKNKKYGDFDGKLYEENTLSSSSSERDEEKNNINKKKYIVRVDEAIQAYNLERKTSYHERPVYHSDIGGSDLSDIVEDVKVQQKEEEEDTKDINDDTNYDADIDIKYPDLTKKSTPHPLTQSDIGYTSDNDPNDADIEYDGEDISQQHLSDIDSSDYKEPKQDIAGDAHIADEVYDYNDDISWNMFDECEQCMLPFMRLFGYNNNNNDYYDNAAQIQETKTQYQQRSQY